MNVYSDIISDFLFLQVFRQQKTTKIQKVERNNEYIKNMR